jgi:DNA-binding CsgD family transcriptional regulator
MASELGREGVFAQLVDDVVGNVADGLSVHVVGPHGSGRSELLQLVADRLDDDGHTVMRLHGNPAWRQEPFAALVAAGVGPASAPGPRRSVGEMSVALSQQLRGAVVLVCDDADDLDLQSVGALLAVHQQRGLTAVTGSRPRVPVRRESLMLGITPAVRVRMPVLDIDTVHGVCRSVLGGPVDASTVARITMKSGGLHGLVRAIATVGRQAGSLRLQDGVWTAPGVLWSEQLAAAVAHYLADADQGVWDGATTLALTGPLPLDEAEKLVDRQLLDRLFTSGLVTYSDDGAMGVVGIFPPLLGDYLRREGSPFGLAQSRDVIDRAGILPAPSVRGDLDPDPVTGGNAAVLNQRLARDAAQSVARCRKEWQLDPRPETALDLVVALRAAGAPAWEIEYVARDTPLGPESEPAAMLVTWRVYWLAVDQKDLAGALTLLDEHAPALPRFATLLRATRDHLIFLRDRVPESDVVRLAESTEGTEEPVSTEARTCLRVELLLGAGKTEQARAVLASFQPEHRVFISDSTILTGLAAVLAGDLAVGVSHAREQLREANLRRSPGSAQAHSYVAVLGLGISGQLAEASQLMFGTLSMTTVAAFRDIYHTGLLVLGAEIAIGQGRADHARALAAQATAADTGSGPYPGMDPGIIEGLLPEATSEARGDLWRTVDSRLERGYVPSALFLAAEAVERMADADRARVVRDRAEETESPLLQALGRYVLAAATDDEAALATVADEFAALAAGLYAFRAAVGRALALRHLGRSAEAAEVADEVWRRSAFAGYVRAGLFARLHEDIGLSPREYEILAMLGDQLTTAKIALTLQMSLRTAETHVHNISRKVGLSGREQLARAAIGWLRPA